MDGIIFTVLLVGVGLAILPTKVVLTDLSYFGKRITEHDYLKHLVVAKVLQYPVVLLGFYLCDCTLFNAMLWASALQCIFWGGKEIMSLKQETLTFGLLPNSTPDWRDWRMSMYGVVLANIMIAILHLIGIV